MTLFDIAVVMAFLLIVAIVSLRAAAKETGRDGYFLAGRKLPFWLVGFSLIASNISTEHFVGMTGTAAKHGISVASWEWVAVIALVIIAWKILPIFLRTGITTIPEFLELRYDRRARSLLAGWMALLFIVTVLATVLYGGATFVTTTLNLAKGFESWFGMAAAEAENFAFIASVWAIGFAAGVYTVFGGLKAVVWSDLLQGSALLLGGALVLILGLLALGDGSLAQGFDQLVATNPGRFHLVDHGVKDALPASTLIAGIWIPVFFYWGFNQFITQRALAAGSLSEGQKGLLFAAAIKLFLPLVVVLPGLLAISLSKDPTFAASTPLGSLDSAYPWMVRELLPSGLFGLVMAAILGAVLSTFNSGLNSAATLLTLDLYAVHVKPNLTDSDAVRVGKWASLIVGILACLWAPLIRSFDGLFDYIQEFWGFVSIPTTAVIVVGLLARRVPSKAAHLALYLGPLLYFLARLPKWIWSDQSEKIHAQGGLQSFALYWSELHYLHHFFGIFLFLVGLMLLIGALSPLPAPRGLARSPRAVDLTPYRLATPIGITLILAVVALYLWLW